MVADQRTAGSPAEFDNEWREALSKDDSRYLIYPTKNSGRQTDLIEWIKSQQIIAILKQFGMSTGTILEYGCGGAGISIFLASLGYQCHICDLSINAIKLAHRNQSYHGFRENVLISSVADAIHLPFDENSFDIVMSFGLLEHFEIKPLEQLINETMRVLKSGGLFIADIIPSPKRLNARTFGILLNYIGSTTLNFVSGKWFRIPQLYHLYFENYYESTLGDREWAEILEKHHYSDLNIKVCRPFPPLAISGKAEEYYTRLIFRFLTFHKRFDRANNWLTRRWGWMYLIQGRKP